MGLSKSKPKHRKGEEPKRGFSCAAPKGKDRQAERPSPEPKPPDRAAARPADSLHLGPASGKPQRPSASSEDKAGPRQQLSEKRSTIPKITITRASNETLISYSSSESEEQRTIREQVECGPYQRHRNPSTIAAYNLHSQE